MRCRLGPALTALALVWLWCGQVLCGPLALELKAGFNLVSAPLDASTTAPYSAADLVQDTGSPLVVRIARAAGGETRFSAYLPGLGIPPFLLERLEGYLIRAPVATTINYSARGRRAPGTISTIAGNGRLESGGDGGLARLAGLGLPLSIALDGHQGLYVSDGAFHRVWRIDFTTGLIRAVAGSGATTDGRYQYPDHGQFVVPGGTFSGDGGPATSAGLFAPWTVRVDGQGDLYIADTINGRIRKVEARTGLIRTVIGTGFQRDPWSFQPVDSGDGGPATSATISDPKNFDVDRNGNLYLASFEGDHPRVRRVDAHTGTITTVAGNGIADPTIEFRFSNPPVNIPLTGPIIQLGRLRFDRDGLLYSADGSLVVKYDFAAGRLIQVTPQPPRTPPRSGVKMPYDSYLGIALGRGHFNRLPNGNWLFVDDSNRVMVMDANGFLYRFAGDWWKWNPIYISSPGRYTGDGGPATRASLSRPEDLAVDTDGTVYIADTDNHVIRKVTPSTAPPEPR